MKLLLDTHILLWYITDDMRLSSKAKNWINDETNEAYYSLVTLWEVAIKHQISSDRMPVSDDELANYADQCGIVCLPLTKQHISLLKSLTRAKEEKPHHDPFDRMLICQAKAEGMLLVTHDSLIPGYRESCIAFV